MPVIVEGSKQSSEKKVVKIERNINETKFNLSTCNLTTIYK